MGPMFDTLLQLPLFQGLCYDDFSFILEKVQFHFDKHRPGETIIASGTSCTQLRFLLKGSVSVVTSSKENTYTIIERLEAPCLIEGHSLFGMHTQYVSSYIAQTEVHTVSIQKSFVMSELFRYEIFRLNYMNIVSNRAQTLHKRLWDKPKCGLKEKIVWFLLAHFDKPQGEKIVKVKKQDLARLVEDTPQRTSKVLCEMQNEGLLEVRRMEILIPEAKRLMERNEH